MKEVPFDDLLHNQEIDSIVERHKKVLAKHIKEDQDRLEMLELEKDYLKSKYKK